MPTIAVSAAAPAWHTPLLEFLPLIRSTAAKAFCHLSRTERQEAIDDVVADSAAEFARLAARGKARFWYLPALAKYAVRRRVAGRRVGTACKKREVLSPVPRDSARVLSLDALEGSDPPSWRAAVADSKRTDPAEAAAFRVDFGEWLSSLNERQRELIAAFTRGDRPCDIAKRLGVTPGRVSQLRAELRASWLRFQGEEEEVGLESLLAAA